MDNLPPKEIADEDMINQAFQQLLNDYLSTKHRKKVEIITKAFNFANQAHKGIKRRSGEPYIMHPIAVASIVCNEIGLGSTSICAALLHDVVEDTDYTVEDIENIFGPKIAQIVDGLRYPVEYLATAPQHKQRTSKSYCLPCRMISGLSLSR